MRRVNTLEKASAQFFYSAIAERLFTNAWYSLVTKLDKNGEETFMNYGFAELEGTKLELAPRFEVHRCAVQLYHHVLSHAAVRGKDVLEIGCGRGGGASYAAANLHPRRYVGLDINKTAIAFDRRFYGEQKNLEFIAGDAHALPFGGDAFDVGETFSGVDFEAGVEAAREFGAITEVPADGTPAAKVPVGGTPAQWATAQWALRWVVQQPGVSTVIPGARSTEQARQNAEAATLPPLSQAELDAIEGLYDKYFRAKVHDRW